MEKKILSWPFFMAVLLVVFAFFMHLDMRLYVISSNGDDFRSLYRGLFGVNGGIQEYLNYSYNLAMKQGRFYFVVTDFISQMPYLIGNNVIRSVFLTGLYFLAGISVAYVIWRFYKSLQISIVFLLLYLYLIPVYGAWYAYFHWTAYWMMPIVIFGLAIWSHAEFMTVRGTFKTTMVYFAYFVLISLSIVCTEMYFLGFGLLILLHYMMLREINSISQVVLMLKQRDFWLTAAPFFVYLCIYIWFYKTNAVTGNRVGSKLAFSFNPVDVYVTLKAFIYSALPINDIVLLQSNKKWLHITHGDPLAFSVAKLMYFVFIVLVAGVTTKLIMLRGSSVSVQPFAYKKLIGVFLVGLSFALLQIFTVTYQKWLATFKPWYTPSFHISVGLLACLAILLVYLFKRVESQKLKAVLAICCFSVLSWSMFHSINSFKHVSDALQNQNVPLHMLYKLRSSPISSNIRNGDTIIYPELKMPRGVAPEIFFTQFFNKPLKAATTFEGKAKTQEFIFNVRRGGRFEETYLLIAKVEGYDEIEQDYQVSRIIAVPYAAINREMTLSFSDQVVGDAKSLMPVAHVQRYHDAFVAKLNGTVLLKDIHIKSKRDITSAYQVSTGGLVKKVVWDGCTPRVYRNHINLMMICSAVPKLAVNIESTECVDYKLEYEIYLKDKLKKISDESKREQLVKLCPGDNDITLDIEANKQKRVNLMSVSLGPVVVEG